MKKRESKRLAGGKTIVKRGVKRTSINTKQQSLVGKNKEQIVDGIENGVTEKENSHNQTVGLVGTSSGQDTDGNEQGVLTSEEVVKAYPDELSQVDVLTNGLNLPDETNKPIVRHITEEEVPMEKRNKRVFVAGTMVALVTIFMTGGVFALKIYHDEVLKNAVSQIDEKDANLVELSESVEVETTDQVMAKNEIKIEILNGSGVSGRAGKVASELNKLGYDLTTVGNEKITKLTRVEVRPGSLIDQESLEKDINSVIGKVVVGTLTEMASYDLRIILGTDLTSL
jgi:hypothetical protein